MTHRTPLILGGLAIAVVAAGAIISAAQAPVSRPGARAISNPQSKGGMSRTNSNPVTAPIASVTVPPQKNSAILPTTQTAAGSLLASYQAVSHNPAPANAIQTAPDPADPKETWALVPEGIDEAGNAAVTLWFGVQTTPNGPWTWIPSTLPGRLSRRLPLAARDALQWGYDLHEGQPGPANLPGAVSWAGITGRVSEPQGWIMQSVTAEDSATAEPGVSITVWVNSYVAGFSGLYGVSTDWDAHNMMGGTNAPGLNMLEESTWPLSTVTKSTKFLKH